METDRARMPLWPPPMWAAAALLAVPLSRALWVGDYALAVSASAFGGCYFLLGYLWSTRHR